MELRDTKFTELGILCISLKRSWERTHNLLSHSVTPFWQDHGFLFLELLFSFEVK